MTATALALVASLVSGIDPDTEWDQLADQTRQQRKCPPKGGDEICTWLAAFRAGAVPPELGATQFGLGRALYVDDATPDYSKGSHLVVGGKPLHVIVVKPDDDAEAKQQVDLAAAYWKGAAPATDQGTQQLISLVKGELAKPAKTKRSARTETIRNEGGPGGIAIRVFEKRLYVLTFKLENVKGSFDARPAVTIAAMGLSAP